MPVSFGIRDVPEEPNAMFRKEITHSMGPLKGHGDRKQIQNRRKKVFQIQGF